jgi:hypothetical protein
MVEMMAQSHIRMLPASELEELAPDFDPKSPELAQADFNPMAHNSARLEQIWSTYYDVFKSQRSYGANLQNLDAVQALIDHIVKRDRLPSRNSLEAQQLLRDAWNTVDVCAYTAARYKRFAKTSYILCLLLSIAVIVLTVLRESIDGQEIDPSTPSCMNPDLHNDCTTSDDNTLTCTITCSHPDETEMAETRLDASTAIFITSALLTVVTGVTAFNSPSQRWRELRAVAESLQSDIFMFRSRTGIYTVDRAEPRKPEASFIGRIGEARLDVVQLAGLTESSFLQKYKDKVYCHGQNEGSSADTFEIKNLSKEAPADMEHGVDDQGRVIDNHHSPM